MADNDTDHPFANEKPDTASDADGSSGANGQNQGQSQSKTPADRLEAEPFMSHANDYEMYGQYAKVHFGGNSNLSPNEVQGIRDSNTWKIDRINADGVYVEELNP